MKPPRASITGAPSPRTSPAAGQNVSVPKPRLQTAVIITCHNYGHYLANCIESVLGQTVPASEIVVVDDASTDNTRQIADMSGVKYLRVEHRNLLKSRLSGFDATVSPIVCFLDADDMLPGDYIEKGVAHFHRPNVGCVWSDMQEFGYSHKLRTMSPIPLTQDNYIHAAAMTRRSAVELSGIRNLNCPNSRSEDWLLWRLLERDKWQFAKNEATYLYRRHRDSMSHVVNAHTWQGTCTLPYETITLFIPFAGREHCWAPLTEWLEQQTFPKERISLILCNTSVSPDFTRRLRQWAANSDYPDVRCMDLPLGVPEGIADENRRQSHVRLAVQSAVARIYRTLMSEATHDYIWVVEDDIIPPLNAAELLLAQFDKHVMSVTGCYKSAYHKGFIAYPQFGKPLHELPQKPIRVETNGFGCVIIRKEALLEFGVQDAQPTSDYDTNLYLSAKPSHWSAILHPEVVCDHIGIEHR